MHEEGNHRWTQRGSAATENGKWPMANSRYAGGQEICSGCPIFYWRVVEMNTDQTGYPRITLMDANSLLPEPPCRFLRCCCSSPIRANSRNSRILVMA